MRTLHIANKNYSSWSLRPWVLMRTLGIEFTEQMHFFADVPGHSGFESFSPSAKVPCLVEGGLTIWESLAITEYLADTHAGVWPVDKAARAYARAAASEMHAGFSALRNQCSMTCGQRIALHTVTPALTADLNRLERLWGMGLEAFGGPFLAGPAFSAVDAFFSPVAFRLQSYDLSLGGEASAYVERLLALPAMRDWYQAALLETARDGAHEIEIAEAGVITADYRATA